MTIDSTLFPRCNPQEAPPGSGLVCGAVAPIVEGVAWDTTGCPVPEAPCETTCEQCPDTSGGAAAVCAGVVFNANGKTYTQGANGCITESGACIPDGVYTQITYANCIPTYGTAPTPVIDFGTPAEWCNLGVLYSYANGQITTTGTPIPDGVYTRFTVQGGCIIGADLAPLPVYQPSECCDDPGSGSVALDCNDVSICLSNYPYAGTAPSTTRFIGQDGNSYTIDLTAAAATFDCDDVKTCLASFTSGGTAGAATQLVGVDGLKYLLPSSLIGGGAASSGISGSYCGGMTYASGSLTELPVTVAALGVNNSEVSWPPVLGATTESWLEVAKVGCKLNFTVNEAGLLNAVVNQFASGSSVPSGTLFLADDGYNYSIEEIAAKVDSLLNLTARLTAVEAALTLHKAQLPTAAHPS